MSNLRRALEAIRSFWTGDIPPPSETAQKELDRLSAEYGRALPPEFETYATDILPATGFCFDTVGNPIYMCDPAGFSRRVEGYSHDANTGAKLPDWASRWLLIGSEGGDPIVVDVRETETPSQVFQAAHGAGAWDFHPVADSVAQFLLLAAARGHALTHLLDEDPCIDDEHGFNLHPDAAAWLFPRVREWAPDYYEFWLEAFENR